MINTDKFTESTATPQIAGLQPNDPGIELMAVVSNKKKRTLWLQHGNTHYFTDLPIYAYNLLKNAYLKDHKAVGFLSNIHKELKDQVELYAHYMYGDVDGTPDILDGKLADSENYRSKRDCPSLLWNSKNITIDDYTLSARELLMIDMMSDDYKDAVIAEAINVCHSHYDTLKRKLFKATNTFSKTSLVLKAKIQKVI